MQSMYEMTWWRLDSAPHYHGIEHFVAACSWIIGEDGGDGEVEGSANDMELCFLAFPLLAVLVLLGISSIPFGLFRGSFFDGDGRGLAFFR